MRNLIITCALLLVVAGCSDEASKPQLNEDPTGYPAATTIAQLLSNLRQSYVDMDYDEYEKLLDDNYVFVFDLDDVGPDTDFQEEWPRANDLQSTHNMFTGEPNTKGQAVDSIEIEFVASQPDTSSVDPAWQRVILTAVELTVETTNQDGDKWYLMTPGNYEVDLHLVESQNSGGVTVWKIIRFEDEPPSTIAAGSATEATSWGAIKGSFR